MDPKRGNYNNLPKMQVAILGPGKMNFQKSLAWRSKKYLAWIDSLECIHCHGSGGDHHHLIGIGNMGGMGTKAPDSMAMPMCRECHGMFHLHSELWPMQWEYIARTLDRATREGVLK